MIPDEKQHPSPAWIESLPVDPVRLGYYDVFSLWRGTINVLAAGRLPSIDDVPLPNRKKS